MASGGAIVTICTRQNPALMLRYLRFSGTWQIDRRAGRSHIFGLQVHPPAQVFSSQTLTGFESWAFHSCGKRALMLRHNLFRVVGADVSPLAFCSAAALGPALLIRYEALTSRYPVTMCLWRES